MLMLYRMYDMSSEQQFLFFMFKGAALKLFFLWPFLTNVSLLSIISTSPRRNLLSCRSTWLVFGVGCMRVEVLLKSPMFRNSAHKKSKGEVTSKPQTAVTSVKQEPRGWTDRACPWEWALMTKFLPASLFSLQETPTENFSFILLCRR